jgi:L-amino acid N-acyltransferase YncA
MDRAGGEASIRPATTADAEAIAGIYNHYVTNTIVTFEEQVVSPSEMARRMQQVWTATLPWLVAEVEGQVVGYAYADKWKGRSAYRFSAEATVYLDPAHTRRGFGSRLFGELLRVLQERGTHAVIGGVALPNDASVALLEKFGLKNVGLFREVGYKLDRWIDVGYWQGMLPDAGPPGSKKP